MKKAIIGGIGGAITAGLIVLAPSAFAGPIKPGDLGLTAEEIAWEDAHGKTEVCAVFEANPTVDGFKQIVLHIMDQGFEQTPAGRVMGYSMGAYCPEQLSALSANLG